MQPIGFKKKKTLGWHIALKVKKQQNNSFHFGQISAMKYFLYLAFS